MPSTLLFLIATVLLSFNFVRLFGLAISDWLYFGALVFALIETLLAQRSHAPCWLRNRFLWALPLILLGAIISTMNAQNWFVAFIEISQQVFVMTFFVSLVWVLVRRGKIKPIIYAFIFSGIITAGVVLVDYFTGSKFGPFLSGTPNIQLWGRYAGTLGHPNKLGYFLVLTTLLSIGQVLNIETSRAAIISRFGWYASIVVQVFGIYLSGSMTAYLGLLTGIIIFALSSKNIFVNMTRTFGGVVTGVLLAGCFLIATQINYIESLVSHGNNVITQAIIRIETNTGETRLANYIQAWEKIAQNPWFGVGYDQISTSGISTEARFLEHSVHNPLLEIWYTGGVFAFLGWVAIYFQVGLTALMLIWRGKYTTLSPLILGLASAALSILLMDQFQDAIYQREKWLVFGMLVSISWEKVWGRLYKTGFAFDQKKNVQPAVEPL
jgi:O-antigen ligase